jgi:hypothetical protein
LLVVCLLVGCWLPVGIIMNGVQTLFADTILAGSSASIGGKSSAHGSSSGVSVSGQQAIRSDQASACLTLSAQLLAKDVVLFSRGLRGEWIKGQIVKLSISQYLFLIVTCIMHSVCRVIFVKYSCILTLLALLVIDAAMLFC